ncbi:ABC transporter permease subunit (plasmid) [Rhodococcus globerulus]|uniref:branched-chain amino acid ABC transporter ATP-binding protein/permease n=1 Tax=Rhodococcus globerulus TaxID=33008 RepID=UPI0039E9CC6A
MIAALVLPQVVPPNAVTALNLIAIYSILAMSLDLLVGYTGLQSLGQATFFGVGSYCIGILIANHSWGWWPALGIAMLVGTLAALLVGSMSLHLDGLFFSVTTIAFSQILWGMAQSWGEVTGGSGGLQAIPRFSSALQSDVVHYYIVLAVAVASGLLLKRLGGSSFGLTLRGIRDSEARMSTTGYNPRIHKLTIFVICGFFASLSGTLAVSFNGFVNPSAFELSTSFDAMLMVILGGAGTVWGAVLGAIGVVGIRTYLSSYIEHSIIILGLIYILAVRFAPNGILGLTRSLTLTRRNARKTTDAEIDSSEVSPEPQGPPAEDTSRTEDRLPNPQSGWTSELSPSRLARRQGPSALSIKGLSRSYGNIHAVADISLDIAPGQRLGVLGPNGAGKTTLFNLISGAVQPTSGEIKIFGEDATRMPMHARAKLGLGRTYQTTKLFPSLSVLDNARLGAMGLRPERFSMLRSVTGQKAISAKVQGLLEFANLWHLKDIPVKELSYGHQRQLELVVALGTDPDLLLLDEPAAGLSIVETKPMVELVKSLDPGLTVLIIEHDMDVAFEVADDLIVMHNGALLAQGSQEQVRADSRVQDVYFGRDYSEN